MAMGSFQVLQRPQRNPDLCDNSLGTIPRPDHLVRIAVWEWVHCERTYDHKIHIANR